MAPPTKNGLHPECNPISLKMDQISAPKINTLHSVLSRQIHPGENGEHGFPSQPQRCPHRFFSCILYALTMVDAAKLLVERKNEVPKCREGPLHENPIANI